MLRKIENVRVELSLGVRLFNRLSLGISERVPRDSF